MSSNSGTLDAINCDVSVIVNDQKGTSSGNQVQYRQSSTPEISSVSPPYGTILGGTTITISGSGFTGAYEVLIDGVSCNSVTVVNVNTITCQTQAAPALTDRTNSLESEFLVRQTSIGYAMPNGHNFFYADSWSSTTTWGGANPPIEGELVSIPSHLTVVLDISTPILGALIVEGALIIEDTDGLVLNAKYIFIRNGRLQAGTREKPILNNVQIVLHGSKEDPHLPHYGNKVLALREGVMDLHGKEYLPTWTLLESTANVGATSIVVQGNPNWEVGQEIIIASTDHDHYNSERRTITSITNDSPASGQTTINFAEELLYTHLGETETFDGTPFEFRAEVGLLSRTLKIRGDDSSPETMYGGHIMSFSETGDDSSVGRISHVEIFFMGQAHSLGRYACHFHLIGNVHQSYVYGNSFHDTYNRAVTIHGVHYLKVQHNVAYMTMGHTIFIEDGIETHNLIEENLVLNVKSSEALLNTDQTPACFWITNPNNIWRNNHCGGSDRYGFWFDLREHPEGPSATTSVCPVGVKLGEFTGNVVHSVVRYALRVFHEHIPRTYPCQPHKNSALEDPYSENPPIPAVYENFFGWKNGRDTVIGERLGATQFVNILSADN